jgi:hypothetical protein
MLQRTDILAGDFFVAVQRRRRLREWSWEIQRRSKPLGVRLDGDGFKSEFAAKLAGEKALRDFLDGLAQEENLWARAQTPIELAYTATLGAAAFPLAVALQ